MTEDTSSQTPLRVVVHLRRRDLLRGQWHVILRDRIWIAVFIVSLGLSIYLLWDLRKAAHAWFFSDSNAVLAALAFALASLLTAAGVVFRYLCAAPLLLWRLMNAPSLLGEHTFEISESGLREITELGETRIAFGHARRVFRTRSFLFVLLAPRTLLLPRRDFADAGVYREFWKALQPLAAK